MGTFVQKPVAVNMGKTNRSLSGSDNDLESTLHPLHTIKTQPVQQMLNPNDYDAHKKLLTTNSQHFVYDFKHIPVDSSQSFCQTKLKVGSAGDKYEQEADRMAEQVMRMPDEKDEEPKEQTQELIQCENGGSTSSFQLRSPFLEGTMFSRPTTTLELDPPSLNLDIIEQMLDPQAVIRAIRLIDPAVSVPIGTTEQANPVVPAGPNPESVSTGDAGDVFRAIASIPVIETYMGQLQALVLSQLEQSWDDLSTLERIPVITVGGLIGVGALAGVFSNPDTRQWALNLIGDRTFPVPGVNGLNMEFALDLETGNVRVGLHLDVGALLPESLGFGPSSPTPLGGPPTPADWESRPEEVIRPKLKSESDKTPDLSLEKGISNLQGSGQPLSAENKNFFETRFDQDFSHVRVHCGEQESMLADGINAKAFTIGNNIVFGKDQYKPGSNEGKSLLAHELTHVVQQKGKTHK